MGEGNGGKKILVTTEDNCFEISSTSTTTRVELTSTQEEPDTRVLLHAADAAAEGYRAAVVMSEDTSPRLFYYRMIMESVTPFVFVVGYSV